MGKWPQSYQMVSEIVDDKTTFLKLVGRSYL